MPSTSTIIKKIFTSRMILKNILPNWENKKVHLPGSLWETSWSGLWGRSTSPATKRKVREGCVLEMSCLDWNNPQIRNPGKREWGKHTFTVTKEQSRGDTVLFKVEKCYCLGKVLVGVEESWSQFILKLSLKGKRKR